MMFRRIGLRNAGISDGVASRVNFSDNSYSFHLSELTKLVHKVNRGSGRGRVTMDRSNHNRPPSPALARSPSPFRSPSPLMSNSNALGLGLSPTLSAGSASDRGRERESPRERGPPSYADSSLDRSPLMNPMMLDDRPRVPPPIYLRSSTNQSASHKGSLKINVPAWSVLSTRVTRTRPKEGPTTDEDPRLMV